MNTGVNSLINKQIEWEKSILMILRLRPDISRETLTANARGMGEREPYMDSLDCMLWLKSLAMNDKAMPWEPEKPESKPLSADELRRMLGEI